jgi:hypothetical protein
MDMNTKISIFTAAIKDVYREEEKRKLYSFPKMDLCGDFTDDLTAMLFAMYEFAKKITGNDWDIIDFTHVLNKLAVQCLLEDKEDKDNDN